MQTKVRSEINCTEPFNEWKPGYQYSNDMLYILLRVLMAGCYVLDVFVHFSFELTLNCIMLMRKLKITLNKRNSTLL